MTRIFSLEVIVLAALVEMLIPTAKAMMQEIAAWPKEDRERMVQFLRTPEGERWRDEESARYKEESAGRKPASSSEEIIQLATEDIKRSFRKKLEELKSQ